MSNDLYSEILSIRSEVDRIRADVASVAMSQAISSIDNSISYPAGVDFCEVKDVGYQQSRARSRGVNRIFSLSDGDEVMWVIERPTWLKETGEIYSICKSRMCEYYDGDGTIYMVCCGKLKDGMAEPGTFYMGKSGDSITVSFRKTSDNKDLSCYLGEYDTAIAIGSIAEGEAKPTVFVCGAITPGGVGCGGSTDVRLPWSLSYNAQTNSIVAYRPAWKSICVDDAHIVRGTIYTEMNTDAQTRAEEGHVYATISTHVGSSNPELGVIVCHNADDIIEKSKIGETLYVHIGNVSISTSDDGNKSVSVKQDTGALGVISEDVALYNNLIAYRESGKYYSISKCSCLSGCAATGDDGLVFASSVHITYTMACGASGTVFSHQPIGTGYEELVLAYEPQVRVVPFLWANLKDSETDGNQQ